METPDTSEVQIASGRSRVASTPKAFRLVKQVAGNARWCGACCVTLPIAALPASARPAFLRAHGLCAHSVGEVQLRPAPQQATNVPAKSRSRSPCPRVALPEQDTIHCLMCGSSRSKTVAVIGRRWVPPPLQNLHHRLLEKSIERSWDT
jgi:hypothetical protein